MAEQALEMENTENKLNNRGNQALFNQNLSSVDLRCFTKSFVLNTLMLRIFLNNASLDHIGAFSFKDNAKKSMSSANSSDSLLESFSPNLSAFPNWLEYSTGLTNFTVFFNSKNTESRSGLASFDLISNSSEYTEEKITPYGMKWSAEPLFNWNELSFPVYPRNPTRTIYGSQTLDDSPEWSDFYDLFNSLRDTSGELKFSESDNIRLLVNESLLKKENKAFVSAMSFIYTHPFDLSSLNLPLRAFFDSFSISSSVNSLFWNSLLSLSSISCFLIPFRNILLAISDQFTHENFSISCFDESSIENVTLTIYSSPIVFSNLFNFAILSFIPALNTSGQSTSGNSFSLSFISLEIDNVTFTILVPPYVYKRKYVDIYKSFAFEESFSDSIHNPALEAAA